MKEREREGEMIHEVWWGRSGTNRDNEVKKKENDGEKENVKGVKFKWCEIYFHCITCSSVKSTYFIETKINLIQVHYMTSHNVNI